MKKLIPNISKMAMGGEPPRKTIYVSNKNNPKLKIEPRSKRYRSRVYAYLFSSSLSC